MTDHIEDLLARLLEYGSCKSGYDTDVSSFFQGEHKLSLEAAATIRTLCVQRDAARAGALREAAGVASNFDGFEMGAAYWPNAIAKRILALLDAPPAPDPAEGLVEDDDPLTDQLEGRARFLRDRGEIKSPEIMERAANALRAAYRAAKGG